MATKLGEYINLLPLEKAQKQVNLLDGTAEIQLPLDNGMINEKALETIALVQALKSLSQAAQLN